MHTIWVVQGGIVRQKYRKIVQILMVWVWLWTVVGQPAPSIFAMPNAALVETDLPAYLAQFPGPLGQFREGNQTAAGIIRSTVDWYGVSPRMMLALLEASSQLLSRTDGGAAVLATPITDSPVAPRGFAAQIDWAAAGLRAGLGPYDRPPVVQFSDGVTTTIDLNQAPEGVAMQRVLAHGRTRTQWVQAVKAFVQAFATYFDGALVIKKTPPAPPPSGFLYRPWQAGVRVRHLAYFDHQYPTVDSKAHDNGVVVNYLGVNDVQYDGHDGHDFAFPDQLIGTPILAAAAGIAYASTRRGNGVYITHADGYTTVYWHLDRFSRRFKGLINSGKGVQVAAGDVIGSSGKSGFVIGTPHLHFEVRRDGKQVDPYGWYGKGADPCPRDPACLTSTWLWHSSLRGEFDFTPPDQAATVVAQPPAYSVVVAPRPEYRFVAAFDGGVVPDLAQTPLQITGYPLLVPGKFGQAVQFVPGSALVLSGRDRLLADSGSLSVWVDTAKATTGRHYLFASSAQPDASKNYTGTIAVRYEVASDGHAQWVFWSVSDDGTSDELRVPRRDQGFHHITARWQQATGLKQFFIDGILVAQRQGVALPTRIADTTTLGRFPRGKSAQLSIDDLLIWRDAPTPDQLKMVATANDQQAPQYALRAPETTTTIQLVPIRASNDPVVVMRVAVDGEYSDPQPLNTQFTVTLPYREGVNISEMLAQVAVELTTRSGVVQTVQGVVSRLPVKVTEVHPNR
jgi:murein DD-endopeptidase MepM/ murein hydrolase activator NlpD